MKNVLEQNYHWIKIDETKHWKRGFLFEIAADVRIFSTYVFDHNSKVNFNNYLSYELHRVATDFETSAEMNEKNREYISEKIQHMMSDCSDILYRSCDKVDERVEDGVRIVGKSKPIREFVGCDDVTTIDDVIQFYKKNPW